MGKARFGFWVATWFGTGLSPVAPGTVATIAALPVHFALVYLPSLVQLAVIVVLTAIGSKCAGDVARELDEKDPQIVVVDESASILLALWIAAPDGLVPIAATVLLFRVLDIFKPWPLRQLERLEPPALGIMADDVAAGILAGIVVRLLL